MFSALSFFKEEILYLLFGYSLKRNSNFMLCQVQHSRPPHLTHKRERERECIRRATTRKGFCYFHKLLLYCLLPIYYVSRIKGFPAFFKGWTEFYHRIFKFFKKTFLIFNILSSEPLILFDSKVNIFSVARKS